MCRNPVASGLSGDPRIPSTVFAFPASPTTISSLSRSGAAALVPTRSPLPLLATVMNVEDLYAEARCLHHGEGGTPKNLSRAEELYSRAISSAAHVESMFSLGVLLEDAHPHSASEVARAVALYERAAAAGHAKAMFNLALLSSGDDKPGVEADNRRAVDLFQRAYDVGGIPSAMYNLGLLLRRGASGLPPDEERAAAAYQTAIDDAAHVGAMFHLAGMLYDGAGHVAHNRGKALELMGIVVDKDPSVPEMTMFAKWLMYEEDCELRDAMRAKAILERALELEETKGERKNIRILLSICDEIIEQDENEESESSQLTGKSDNDGEGPEYDVFISHAGTEKQTVAIPLMKGLEEHGLKCFLDEEELRGSTKTGYEQLFGAMRGSRTVVFILSLDFAARKWPMMELREFLRQKEAAEQKGQRGPLIIPLFHKLSVAQCKDRQLPYHADHMQLFMQYGFFEHDRQRSCPTTAAMDALASVAGFVGLRNDDGDAGEAFAESIVERIVGFFEEEFGAA